MRFFAVLLGALLPLAAGEPVTVLAAASLADVLRETGRAFEARHPGTTLRFGFGASNQLRLQLQQGAPADVFASADELQLELLRREGRIRAFQPLAANRLALAVRRPGPVRAWQDLARPGVRLVMTPASVPIGLYSDQLLSRLAQEPGAPPGFLSAVRRNVRSREPNVRQLRAKVELGEADAALLYATDLVPPPPGLGTAPLPEALQPDIRLGIAALAPAGEAFVRFATGPEGRAIFQRHGFR